MTDHVGAEKVIKFFRDNFAEIFPGENQSEKMKIKGAKKQLFSSHDSSILRLSEPFKMREFND